MAAGVGIDGLRFVRLSSCGVCDRGSAGIRRDCSGTALVGESMGRDFKPSTERNFLVGVTLNARF